MKGSTKIFLASLLVLLCIQPSCKNAPKHDENELEKTPFAIQGVTEFKRGDIIVKPNANILPGTAAVKNGLSFGHAVIVSKGYKHDNIDSLLSGIRIIESRSSDVPAAFQVREAPGYFSHEDIILSCTSFGNKYSGNRYRLRLNISEAAVDSILAFTSAQIGDLSCWNASKAFPTELFKNDTTRSCWADNSNWYCSLLVWQACFYHLGIDLDSNGGYMVYPNDLISNSIFNLDVNPDGRARF